MKTRENTSGMIGLSPAGVVTGFLLLGLAVNVGAAPPQLSQISMIVPSGAVNYQAHLKGPTGVDYVEGLYDIDFRLYKTSSGGTAVWGAGYKVYVKDGNFSVMLGRVGGTDLAGTTYPAAELWRALWYDEASPNNDFHLGITVKQDQNHVVIPTPTESSPRQQFLCAPFAHRAEQAQYARGSAGDFAVSNALRVAGASTFTGAGTFNNGLTVQTAGSLTVNRPATFGNSAVFNNGVTVQNAGNFTVDRPATFNQALTVNNTAALKSTATFDGAATFKNGLAVNTAGVATFDRAATFNANAIFNGDTIQNSGNSMMAETGGNLNLRNDDASNRLQLLADGTVRLMGNGGTTEVSSDTAKNLYLKATAGNMDVTCNQLWVNKVQPFDIRSYSVLNDADCKWTYDTGVSATTYAAVIVGFDFGNADIDETGANPMWNAMMYKLGGTWWVRCEGPAPSADFCVHVMYIASALVYDGRTEWGWNN